MKQRFWTLLPLLAMLLSACAGNKGEPVYNEADLLWSLSISPQDEASESGIYDLALSWVGPEDEYPAPATASVQFGQIAAGLNESWGAWFGEASLVAGKEYPVRIITGSQVIYEGTIKIAFNAVAYFPETFDPSASATIGWGMNGDNQGQVAILSATSADGGEQDEAQQALSPEVRSWSWPSGAVTNLGYESEYTLELVQICRTGNHRVIVQSIQTASRTYLR